MLVPAELVQAQEKGQVIVISPKVGETIDREERDRYRLFLGSQNFHSAVILQQLDGGYVAEISEERNGKKAVHTLSIDQRTLDLLRDSIENFKDSRRILHHSLQLSQTHTPKKRHRWAILFAYGYKQGNGCDQDLKQELVRSSLSPRGHAEHETSIIMVRHALNRRFGLCLLRSTGAYFYAGGRYPGPWWEPSANLALEGHLTTYAVLVELCPVSFLRLGVGSAFHSLKVKSFGGQLCNDPGPTDNPKSLGLVVEIGLSLPSRSRIFVDLSAKHHIARAVTIGPFDVTYDSGDAPATMAPTSVSIGHTTYALGLGVRF